MVRVTQRTMFSFDIELHRQLGVKYEPLPNTTLNEKYSVLETAEAPTGRYPQLVGFVIGIGGSAAVPDANNFVFNEHGPLDGALFEGIPWLTVPLTKEIPKEEQDKYRLKVIENINGEPYVNYYMKRLENIDLKKEFYVIRAASPEAGHGSPTLKPMDTQKSTILRPVPKERNLSYLNQYTPKYITKIAKIEFEITPEEQRNIQQALAIRGLDGRLITEIGLCSGIEIINCDNNESILTQIAYHVGVNFDLANALAEELPILKGIEIGGLEPLME